ncbi:MAG: response regulator transcription factor [Gemmatimonadaceae bacterium]
MIPKTQERPTILLVEDDLELGEALRAYLDIRGFDLIWYRNGIGAMEWLGRSHADLCVLDVMLPRMDGFEIALAIRKTRRDMPIIFLTARGLKPDRLRGFGVGADDYLVKPVDEDELVARISAVLRRAQPVSGGLSEPMAIGRYEFDPNALTLSLDARRQRLTQREAALLSLLCANQGRLLRRDAALKSIWKRDDEFSRRSMDVFVHRLRRHLRHDPAVSLTTVRGIGLVLDVEPAPR